MIKYVEKRYLGQFVSEMPDSLHWDSTTCAPSKHINVLGLVRGLTSWKPLKYWNQVGGTGKEWVVMGTNFFIAIGVLPVEQLAYQVSMVSAANWPR